MLDEQYPMFSKFFFVFSMGKHKSSASTTEKELTGKASINNVKQLDQAKLFMEGMGYEEPQALESSTSIVNTKSLELNKQVELP